MSTSNKTTNAMPARPAAMVMVQANTWDMKHSIGYPEIEAKFRMARSTQQRSTVESTLYIIWLVEVNW